MKVLGFLFLLVLVVAGVGYFRGWFSVTTVQAGGKSGMGMTIDNNKLGADADALMKQLPGTTNGTEGGNTATPNHEVAGVLAAVDVAARNLTVTVDSQTFVQHVATAVPIRRSGASIGLNELRAAMRAKLVYDRASEPRELLRIELLP